MFPHFIHEHSTDYCSEAVTEIERIVSPNGKIASKLRFIAVVLYKAGKAAARKVI